MNRVKKEKVEAEKKPAKKGLVSRTLNSLLNGEFLTRDVVINHFPFILFLSGLFVVYISIGYSFEQTEREKVRVKRALEN